MIHVFYFRDTTESKHPKLRWMPSKGPLHMGHYKSRKKIWTKYSIFQKTLTFPLGVQWGLSAENMQVFFLDGVDQSAGSAVTWPPAARPLMLLAAESWPIAQWGVLAADYPWWTPLIPLYTVQCVNENLFALWRGACSALSPPEYTPRQLQLTGWDPLLDKIF